jgi:hypothetical protein
VFQVAELALLRANIGLWFGQNLLGFLDELFIVAVAANPTGGQKGH